MAESPTYYHAISPILRRLKEFDMENFPLQQEIVFAKPSLEFRFPRYLKEAETLDPTPVIIPEDDNRSSKERIAEKRMEVQKFLEIFKDCQTSLEESQRNALVHAMQNRLAIIQGIL